MLKVLPKKAEKFAKDLKPTNETLYAILNYSKSLTQKVVNHQKVLINLN